MEILGGLAGVVLFLGLEPSVVVAIIAGIIIPMLGFIATMIFRFHKRLRELERESKSREQVVYGGENNPLNLGLVKEIKSLKKDFGKYQEEQSRLKDKKQELSERIEVLEKEIEKIEALEKEIEERENDDNN
jgi:septal ring factor EnvC (AmiA/AmiB activator)